MKIIKKVIRIISFMSILITCMTLVTFLVIQIRTKTSIFNDVSMIPETEVALILGASVMNDGSLSPVLKHRVDTAVTLYKTKKVHKILVTGDNSTVAYNEVNPVRLYLLDKNIPDQDIFLDHAGFDTYSSMYRARDIFLVHSITVVTQSFHLPRAVFIAQSLGLDAYGMSADKTEYKTRNYVREVFANIKAVMNLALERKPKFLGEEIPISGDGRNNE